MNTFTAIALSCFLAMSVAGQGQEVELLDGRLTVVMPEGSRAEARGRSIMAATRSVRSESRVVYDEGDRRMVVMAWELFSFAGEEYDQFLEERFDSIEEMMGTEFEVTRVNEVLTFGVPAQKRDTDAILYAFAYVRHTDNLIQRSGVS